jgi:diadenosine tetraphosphate (Ap4A) HIT family hydrolase
LPEHCSFCTVSPDEAWIQTDFVVAVPHPSPIAPCHMVVAPRRHVAAFYDLDVQEQQLLWAVVQELRKRISTALKTDGFEVGFADGEGSWHMHIHVIPRIPGEHLALPRDVEWVDLDKDSAGHHVRA